MTKARCAVRSSRAVSSSRNRPRDGSRSRRSGVPHARRTAMTSQEVHAPLLQAAAHKKKRPGLLAYWLKAIWPLAPIAVHLTLGTLIWRYMIPEHETLAEAYYFAVVTFLTIGYGDISPSSNAAKLFFMFYIAISLVLQLTVVSNFISSTVALKSDFAVAKLESVNPYVKLKPRFTHAVYALWSIGFLIITAALMLHFLDGRDWIDSFYWALTTLSTVGYGDITPSDHHVLFATFFLVSVVVFGYLVGVIISILVSWDNIDDLNKFFRNGVTAEMIDEMDATDDGQVSLAEFMMYALRELDLVDEADLQRIVLLFDMLDSNGDGVLNSKDLKRDFERHGAVPVREDEYPLI